MFIDEMKTCELRRCLRATERAVGPDSYAVKVLRRELARRRAKRDRQARKVAKGASDER